MKQRFAGIRIRIVCLLLVAASMTAVPSGCGFSRLQKDLSYMVGNYSMIKGDVGPDTDEVRPVIVALWSDDDPKKAILRYWLMQGRGDFQFMVNAPGAYRMIAFEDADGSMSFGAPDPFGVYPEDGPLRVEPGQIVTGIHIVMGDGERNDLPAIAIKMNGVGTSISIPDNKVSLDEVTDLDDERFSSDKVEMGSWEPSRFIREVGGGIFFLEPYDPDRIPVLFFHGADGSPRDWRYVLEHLDRKKVQPWVAYYASGIPLDMTCQLYYRLLIELQLKYRFSRVCIVAHSMGGLLSRGFINELTSRSSPIAVQVFATISTPWAGIGAAEMGVRDAPAVVPSWLDVVPGSPYISSLWKTPLPEQTRYYLLFGFAGKPSPVMNRNNDGVVTIASELDKSAQEAAAGIRGFDRDHNTILNCRDVIDYLNEEVFK